MVNLPMWMPSPLSRAEGKEIEKLSLLGPFLALSVFSEDCVSSNYELYQIMVENTGTY